MQLERAKRFVEEHKKFLAFVSATDRGTFLKSLEETLDDSYDEGRLAGAEEADQTNDSYEEGYRGRVFDEVRLEHFSTEDDVVRDLTEIN